MEVAFAFTVIILIIICAVFIALYIIANQKNTFNLEQVSSIKKYAQTYEQKYNELQNQMHNIAGEHFQKWRATECENIRKQEQKVALALATNQFQNWMFEAEVTIRNDAIQKSHSTIIGQVSEHIVPFMPNFCFNPKDVRFVGSPIDLIIFNGMDDDDIAEIIFVEVKTGASADLSRRQRQIRDAIQSNRVRWEIFRVPRKS
jgi:predicted Holliday junction resolvase-like endonuclease